MKTKRIRCLGGGQWVRSREAARTEHCEHCGLWFDVEPRLNPRVAGEVMPGWFARIPAHDDRRGQKARAEHAGPTLRGAAQGG